MVFCGLSGKALFPQDALLSPAGKLSNETDKLRNDRRGKGVAWRCNCGRPAGMQPSAEP